MNLATVVNIHIILIILISEYVLYLINAEHGKGQGLNFEEAAICIF